MCLLSQSVNGVKLWSCSIENDMQMHVTSSDITFTLKDQLCYAGVKDGRLTNYRMKKFNQFNSAQEQDNHEH